MHSSNSRYPWFALTVKHHHEKAVTLALNGKGLDSYLPLYRSFHRSAGRLQPVFLPVFPGYVFCSLDINKRLPTLTIPGVRSIVSVGRVPAEVPEAEILAVKAMVESDLPVAPHPSFYAGQQVYIECGPLRGVQGTLLECKGNYRLVVAIELLQRAVSTEVDLAWVRPASAPFAMAS